MAVGEQTPLGQLRLKARFLGLEHMLRSDEELAEISAAADRALLEGRAAAQRALLDRPFSVGDVVQLKSGGIPMVVTDMRCAEGTDLDERCLRPADADAETLNNRMSDIPF